MKKMSLNPMRQIWNLATVNEWYYLQESESEYRHPLENAIELGTYISLDPYNFFFSNIYLPIKQMNPTTGLSEQWTYENIGLSPAEISQIYTTYNGLCYIYPGLDKQNPALSIRDLGDRIRSVFLLNKPKYMKLIELQGYTYNPLFNVDGVEIRQSLKNEGVNNANRTYTPSNLTNTHSVSAYNSVTKTEYTDVQSGSYTDNTNYTHNNAKNRMVVDGVEIDVDYHVPSKDTAFGEALSGGDKMENEKNIRQGNIGVTKTQELIQAERENLKFSVIKEFIDDINAQILVGVY